MVRNICFLINIYIVKDLFISGIKIVYSLKVTISAIVAYFVSVRIYYNYKKVYNN